jgi:hypothetical protein
MTMAAAVLLAGCGGGSSNKSAGSAQGSGFASREVTAKSGVFRTVIPLGYRYNSGSQAQYQASGPEEGGLSDSLVVTREPLRRGDMNTLARRTLRAAGHQRNIHRLSGPSTQSVGGEPALAMGFYYLPAEGTGEVHLRQVLVSHGEWVYLIHASAVTAQDATSLRALEELISNWHWQ